MRTKLLSILCILSIAPVLSNAATTIDQVFAKMDEVSKGFHSLECTLEQTKVELLVNDKDVQTGKLYYARAGKEPRLRIEVEKPGKKTLLIDKGKFQLYSPNINEVQEASLGGHANAVDQLMSVGFGQSSADLKKNYKVTLAGEESVDGKQTAMLDLVPITPIATVKAMRLWIDEQKGIVVQVKVTETGGDYTIYKYSNVKINSALPGNIFELKLPKDVHVQKL